MNEVEQRERPDVQFGFGHDLDAPRRARQAVRAMFADECDPVGEDVRLVASELVTNVILHTDDGGELRAYDPRPSGPVRLEVQDSAGGAPAELHPAEHQTNGRGLRIVGDVSRRWGIQKLPAGKIVWAEFG